MKRHKIGIITLAVTLISLGIILLARNFTDLNTSLLLSVLWPSVIILFGLEIVIGKLIIERKKEDTKMTVDSLSVVILVIVVVITFIVTSIGALSINFCGFNIFGDNGWFYSYRSEYSFNYEFEASNKDKIYIDNSHGDVEFKKISGDKILVNAEVKFNHNDEDKADEISKEVVQIDEGVNSLSVKTIVHEYLYRDKTGDLEVSYLIEIPNEIDVDIVNSFGNISIAGNVKVVEINSEHSNVSLKDIKGSVNIDNSFGYVNVEEAVGPVNIYNKHGRIEVNQIENDVVIENSYDKVKVQNINGDVEIINSHDLIEVENITGDIDIRSSYSDIRIAGAKQGIKIINKHGDIRFEPEVKVDKYVDIKNEYGDVRIIIPEGQEGSFKANVKYGDIYNDFGFSVNENTIDQNLLVTIGNSDVIFNLETTHGDLYLNSK